MDSGRVAHSIVKVCYNLRDQLSKKVKIRNQLGIGRSLLTL